MRSGSSGAATAACMFCLASWELFFKNFFVRIVFHFVQEIKFEPNVMCEPVDKKFTFKASQVYEGQRDLTREMGTRFS